MIEKWVIEKINKIDPLSIKDMLLEDRGRAIAWVLNFACEGRKDVWDALPERAPDFFKELWFVIFNISGKSRSFKPIALWIEDSYRSRIRLLTPCGWNVYKGSNREVMEQYFPDPGENWKLVPLEEKSVRSKVTKGPSGDKRTSVKKKKKKTAKKK